jgi:hypothetical protein
VMTGGGARQRIDSKRYDEHKVSRTSTVIPKSNADYHSPAREIPS